ncbi:MAG: hypothetical protein IKT85_05190 [Kiritimatiellae bacterium]|nr:hypothetical protein [Kiritimatiellia bacterium]MBR4946007.1 hypothetical protein [Kiritimatiellia bacterium]
MIRFCALFLLLSVWTLTGFAQEESFTTRPRAYYELIIKSEPFGPMAPDEPEIAEEIIVQDPEKVKEESSKIQLCAMTYTPDGRTAVGLIDNGSNPPGYITLFDGDESNGLTMVLSNLEEEYATFTRDGVMFTLKLGLGLMETITPELLAQREEEAILEEEAQAEIERKRPNSLAEQLIAMQMSLPPDVEAPPLPIPILDTEDFVREFDPNKERGEPETDEEALIQAGVAELHDAVASGETPQEYLKRLVEHRQQEVKRQQDEKARAQQELDEQLASGNLSKETEAYLRRRTNIELMKKGVVPLTPVDDLTEEEQAEIDAALLEE